MQPPQLVRLGDVLPQCATTMRTKTRSPIVSRRLPAGNSGVRPRVSGATVVAVVAVLSTLAYNPGMSSSVPRRPLVEPSGAGAP